MSNLRIIFDNRADASTVTASPAVLATLPVTNLQLDARAKVMRTTSASDQQILLDWGGAAIVASGAVLYGHNLSSAATWRVRLYAGQNQTGTVVYDSTATAAIPIFTLGEYAGNWGVLPLGSSIFTGWADAFSVLWFSDVAAKSARIDLSDSANADGYLQARRLVIGQAVSPAYNLSPGMSLDWADSDSQFRTDGGTLRTDAGTQYRVLKFDLSFLTTGERALWLEQLKTVARRKAVFISVWPEHGGARERDYSLLAKISNRSGMAWGSPNLLSNNLELEET